MVVRIATLCLSACAALAWGGFAVGMVLWGLAAEANYTLQNGAPQQAAVAAYTASGSIIAYSLVRAVSLERLGRQDALGPLVELFRGTESSARGPSHQGMTTLSYGAPLALWWLGPPAACTPEPPAVICPAHLGFAPQGEPRCPAHHSASCCLDRSGSLSRDEALCIADAVGFAEGPGGRSATFEASAGVWRLITRSLPICPAPGGLGGVEGCSLDLDPTTGESRGQASVHWTLSCPQDAGQ